MNNNIKKLVTFGCSFTEGHHLCEENKAWGDYLAKELNISHLNLGDGGSSNEQIFQNVLRFCEGILVYGKEFQNHHVTLFDTETTAGTSAEYLIGIQLSDIARKQWWYEPHNRFWSTPLAALFEDWGDYDGWGNDKEFFQHMNRGKETLIPIEANLRLRSFETIKNIRLISSYLEHHGFKFFIFEGLNSIMDTEFVDGDNEKNYYFTPFLYKNYVDTLLQSSYFFNELGQDMMNHMKNHELFDETENDNHPNPAYAEWYAKELSKWLIK